MALVLDGTNGVSGVDGTASNPAIEGTDSNTGIFYPAADTVAIGTGGTERVRVSSAGVVGVNTTSPAAIGANYGTIDIRGSSGGGFNLGTTGTLTGQIYGNSSGITYDAQGALTHFWYTNSLERMRLDASGNLMVGTTTAADALTVSSSDTDTRIYIQASDTGTGNTNGYMLGTISSVAYVWNYENQPLLFGTNGAQRGRFTEGGYFKASSTAIYSAGTTGAVHEFDTSSVDGTIVNFYNQAASNPNGIYVGYTAADPNDATRYVFGAQQNTGVWIYRIYSNGTVAARSDAKWKKNIETARDGYAEDLAKLRVVKYNWYNHDDGTPKELGLIAQEVEQVFPGLVTTDEQTRNEIKTREIPAVLDEEGNEVEPSKTEEYTEKVGTGEYSKSIKFSVLPIMLLKAIQEQQAMIDELKAEIAALKGNA